MPRKKKGQETESNSIPLSISGMTDIIEYTLVGNCELMLIGEINERTADFFTKAIRFMTIHKAKKVVINIDSGGGHVFSGFSILNAIRDAKKSGVRVIGRVTGLAASMAAVVLQECTERVACKYSRLMVHEVSELKLYSEESASKAAEDAEELQKVNDVIIEIIAKRTKKKTSEIKRLIKKTDVWLSPREALKFKLIDRVEDK